ncbi:hypothetical protein HY837_02605 [archaeon]|nr:hypothetical protein [archaeon]
MAIYTRRIKKLSFIKNRIRDAFLISAFFLGYYTHDKVNYCLNKFEEYKSMIEVYKKQITNPSEDIHLEKILNEDFSPDEKPMEVNNEPRTIYSVPRDTRRYTRFLRKQN